MSNLSTVIINDLINTKMTKEDIVKILEGWEFGAKLSTGEYVRGVKKEYFEAVANDILDQVNNCSVLDSVSKCHDNGHNTYIDYDGKCGACGSKEKQ